MYKEILKKKDELYYKSSNIKSICFDKETNRNNIDDLRKKQDELYKKWQFYDKLIKTIGGEKNDRAKTN